MAILALGFTLSACNLYTAQTTEEAIGYREARFAQISAMRDYRRCRDDATNLDAQARKQGSAARYLASARLLEKCEQQLGPNVDNIAKDERLRSYALSIQNYLKGGDIAKARKNLQAFKKAFPDDDLSLADGSSFIDTMEVLLSMHDRPAIGQFSTFNVNQEVKAELRRVHYWKKN